MSVFVFYGLINLLEIGAVVAVAALWELCCVWLATIVKSKYVYPTISILIKAAILYAYCYYKGWLIHGAMF